MKVKDVIKKLEKWEDKEQHICFSIWQREDVECQAEVDGIKVDEKDCDYILEAMEHNHNAEIGINWDVISMYLSDIERDRQC